MRACFVRFITQKEETVELIAKNVLNIRFLTQSTFNTVLV